MADRLTALLREGKINDEEYQTYILFVANDVGAQYYKKKLYAVVMEEVPKPTKQLFAWQDGRHSVWRDVGMMIYKVETLLKGRKDDRS